MNAYFRNPDWKLFRKMGKGKPKGSADMRHAFDEIVSDPIFVRVDGGRELRYVIEFDITPDYWIAQSHVFEFRDIDTGEPVKYMRVGKTSLPRNNEYFGGGKSLRNSFDDKVKKNAEGRNLKERQMGVVSPIPAASSSGSRRWAPGKLAKAAIQRFTGLRLAIEAW